MSARPGTSLELLGLRPLTAVGGKFTVPYHAGELHGDFEAEQSLEDTWSHMSRKKAADFQSPVVDITCVSRSPCMCEGPPKDNSPKSNILSLARDAPGEGGGSGGELL